MTKQEAKEVVVKMKNGLAFMDEDIFTNELWSLDYDRETHLFSYTTMWMVIGSILSDTKFSEEELLPVLENKFNYAELMANGYQK